MGVRAGELRVLMIIPSLGATGGLERVATTLALGVAPRVARLVVCFGRRGAFEQTLGAAGIALVRIHRPKPRPDRFVRAIVGLTGAIRRERPDIVHAHNPAAGAAAAIACRLAGRPQTAIVTSYHGVVSERADLATRVLGRSSDLVLGVGPSSTQSLVERGLPSERAATIENAVIAEPGRMADEVRRELGLEEAELVVNVGRYVPEKDQATLVAAIAELAPRRPRLRALLVGEGELESALRAQIDTTGLGEVVVLTGPRDDAVDLIAAADVFAISSVSEGLPLVLLEAMTLGRAICATRVGSIGDAVRDGESALLVAPHDPPALAAAIERLLDDRVLASRLGANATACAHERFSAEVMVDRTLDAYVSVVDTRRRRAAARRAGAKPS